MNRFQSLVRSAGSTGAAATLLERTFRPRPLFVAEVRSRLRGATALEIGGPSTKFMPGGVIPLYDVLSSIDNLTFSSETIWEGRLGDLFEPLPGVRGRQFIAEGATPGDVGPYHAVLSSHVIEHLANPIKALMAWRRVLRTGCILILIAPHGPHMFDHRRPITTLEHLIEDFERDTPESDSTHAEEVLRLHDVDRDPGLRNREELRERVENNATLRSMHHHVFDERLVRESLQYSGYRVDELTFRRPYDIVAIAT